MKLLGKTRINAYMKHMYRGTDFLVFTHLVENAKLYLESNSGKILWSHFILSGLNYYVFKLIIWYNALIVYIHVFTLYLYFKKNTCM